MHRRYAPTDPACPHSPLDHVSALRGQESPMTAFENRPVIFHCPKYKNRPASRFSVTLCVSLSHRAVIPGAGSWNWRYGHGTHILGFPVPAMKNLQRSIAPNRCQALQGVPMQLSAPSWS